MRGYIRYSYEGIGNGIRNVNIRNGEEISVIIENVFAKPYFFYFG
jgi:hypothetical protein